MYLDIDGQEEVDLLESILDNTPVLLALMDNKFNFIRVNEAYAKADQKPIDYFPGKNHFKLYPNNENLRIFQRVVDSGHAYSIRGKRFEYPDHPERGVSYWDWSLIPLTNNSEKVEKLVLTLLEVTEREKAKKKLEESHERINFYKNLLAHDMRNILSGISLSMELVNKWQGDPSETDRMNKIIHKIITQVQKGASLISNVQKFSEITKEHRKIDNIDLTRLMDHLLIQFQSRFDGENVQINTAFPNQPVSIKGGDLLFDAFENLLINAISHNTSDIKRIWIEISFFSEEEKDYFKVEFKDNGIGIPDKNIDIFKKGYKNIHSKGMGMGLTLVKAIIDGYGGKIWVEDRISGDYSQGSNFIVLLEKV
ncbi:MAG: putative Histidine kinase [Promethearchaeota archaeon]|nr:MAG: putative Histidine kinase [Candidatus Lokiarchaeota archaeon]